MSTVYLNAMRDNELLILSMPSRVYQAILTIHADQKREERRKARVRRFKRSVMVVRSLNARR